MTEREAATSYIITCPTCGHVGSEQDFQKSLADECFCPNGCEWFLLSEEGDDGE